MSDKPKQKRDFPLLSGLARGLTADIVGGPVDLATILVNSGLAAYGYAGNKLGLLKPSEMPDLIENPVGGSDWFAGKNTPLTDDGSARFTAGRLTGNIAPSLPGAARALAPKAKPGQVNSLLGGLAKDDPSLWLSHGSNPNELLRSDGSLIRELYNPSFAITRDKLSEFKGSKAVIVPWPEKLDPKNAKTLLTATDSYNPRWHASKAGRIDNLPWDVKLDKGLADPRVEEFINQRLFEKLGTPFPRQGIKKEGGLGAPHGSLPELGRGMPGATDRKNPVYGMGDIFANRIVASPRFQSLESFASSPYGGRLIGDTHGRDQLGAVDNAINQIYENLVLPNTNPRKRSNDPDLVPLKEAVWTLGSGYSRIDLLKGLASDTFPGQLYNRNKSSGGFLSQLMVNVDGVPRPLSPDQARQVQKKAGELLGKIKTTPSDYAELKSYGPWQVSGDNVAGIVERKDYYGNSGALREASAARGLPYAFVDSRADETAAAADFLSRKGKSQISLAKGLAAKAPPPSSKSALEKFIDDFDFEPAPMPFTAPSVDVKHMPFSDLEAAIFGESKAVALTPEIEAAYNKAIQLNYALQKKTLEQLKATNTSGFSKADLEKYDEALAAVQKFPGVSPATMSMNTKNFKAGYFDYLMSENTAEMAQYGEAFGHPQLKQLADIYSAKLNDGSDAPEDLENLLTAWDQVVNFNLGKTEPVASPKLATGLASGAPKPAAGVTPEMAAELKALEELDFTPVKEPSLTKGMASPEPGLIDVDGWFAKSIAGASKPVKDWHQASWKELNSLSQSEVEAMPHTEWNVWNAAYSDHMDALLSKDWASESKMHLLDILKSAEWQFYPEGAKTAIKAALGIK